MRLWQFNLSLNNMNCYNFLIGCILEPTKFTICFEIALGCGLVALKGAPYSGYICVFPCLCLDFRVCNDKALLKMVRRITTAGKTPGAIKLSVISTSVESLSYAAPDVF